MAQYLITALSTFDEIFHAISFFLFRIQSVISQNMLIFFFVKGNWILFYNNILMQIKLFNMTLENNSDVKNMRHHCKQIRKCSS